MSDFPMKFYWRGKDIETLSREELIEALMFQTRALDENRAATRSIIDVYDLARKARAA